MAIKLYKFQLDIALPSTRGWISGIIIYSREIRINEPNLHPQFLKSFNNIMKHKLMSSWHASDYVNGSKIIDIGSKSSL